MHRRHALGHGKSSASAEDQRAYQEAVEEVQSMTAQYKQAVERATILRGQFQDTTGGPAKASFVDEPTPAQLPCMMSTDIPSIHLSALRVALG